MCETINQMKIEKPEDNRSGWLNSGGIWSTGFDEYKDWQTYGVKWLALLKDNEKDIKSTIKTIIADITYRPTSSYIGLSSTDIPKASVRYKFVDTMRDNLNTFEGLEYYYYIEWSHTQAGAKLESCKEITSAWLRDVAEERYGIEKDTPTFSFSSFSSSQA